MATLQIQTKTACPHCGAKARVSAKTPLCRSCTNALRAEAFAEQERVYLARYLSCRVDASGCPIEDSALTVHQNNRREIARLVAKARRSGLDWTRPPQPVDFTVRLAQLTSEFIHGTRRKFTRRGPRPKDVPDTVSEPRLESLWSA
jgi:hypothetical protein